MSDSVQTVTLRLLRDTARSIMVEEGRLVRVAFEVPLLKVTPDEILEPDGTGWRLFRSGRENRVLYVGTWQNQLPQEPLDLTIELMEGAQVKVRVEARATSRENRLPSCYVLLSPRPLPGESR